ncbi:MAG: CpaF family protein [Actinomycetota bacterium]
MNGTVQLIESAREALGLRLAESSLLRPTVEHEAEARKLLEEVVDEWNRNRANSNLETVPQPERERFQRRLFDLFFRLGPLQPHLDDESVEEVTVNSPGVGFVVRASGVKERIDPGFVSEEEVRTFISRVVARSGRRIDDASPSVDVRLSDGARLHAMLPPVSRHVSVTIRRHRLIAERLDELVQLGTITGEAAEFLESAVKHRINILVSGGTASGKTTTLNALGRVVPENERIVTVEETCELRLADLLADCVALEARPSNAEGVGEVSIRDLVRHALRMRPNRIIVGEVRGAEALDMISAMNSGHEGSMGTIHANNARYALNKLRLYLLMAREDIPSEVAAEMIAETVQIVVHLQLDASGHRMVSQIAEVAGLDGGNVLINDVFRLDGSQLVRTGVRPRWEEARVQLEEKPPPTVPSENGRSLWAGSRS